MKKIICLLIAILFLCTCRKIVIYSDIPEIRLVSFGKYEDDEIQNGALLIFYFQDGDGDIGLSGTDTYPPFDTASLFYYNFFCDYYEKQDGFFVKIDSIETNKGTEPLVLNARIPRLSSLPEESINGEISLIMLDCYKPFSPYDTFQLKIHIVDRKLNKSNEIEVVRSKK